MSSPSFSYKRNLEPIGQEIQAGGWRIAPLVDLISEKRYLHFRLKSRRPLLESTLSFRGEAATIMAPTYCPETLWTSIASDRIEFLTDYFDVTPVIAVSEFAAVFETVLNVLARFESHRFVCRDLFPQALGRSEDGNHWLLPSAYILPEFVGDTGLAPAPVTGRGMRSRHPGEMTEGSIHPALVRNFMTQLLAEIPDGEVRDGFCERLVQTAEAISRRELTDTADIYRRLFDRDLEGSPRPAPATRAEDPAIESRVDEVINLTAAEGAVIVVRGGPGTGKRAILDKSALLLDRSDTFAARAIDEWDLFAKTFQKAAQRGRSATHPVWVIDDIDEKALVYSDYATAMLDSASFPPGSVVMSVRSSDIRGGVAEFLTRLRKARGDKYSDIDTEPLNADSAGYRSSLRYALDALDGAPSTPRDAPPKKLARQLLAGVNAEERQILEFLSVARFSLPLDVVMNVFSESRRATCAAILDLAKLGCLTLNYRPMPGKDTATLFLRVTDAELRRLIYDCIHAKRRRKLHRTVALLAEQQEGFPKYFLLFHCLESRDTTLSATCAVAYLSETKRGKRHPSVVSLCAELAAGDDLDTLPFAMRILANHELAIDLLAAGRGDEAEALLKQSLDLIEEAEEDQILKMAPRLSETFRLLADRWESRGDFKRALELLEWARDDLQSALPIPDQAQLLNDIGWLLYRLGDYSRSLECCRMSLNTLSANQYPLIVSQALNLMGVVHFNTSRYDEAISYYEQSAVLRERAGDKNALAASYNNLALAYQSKGEFEKAFDHHNKSLKLKMHQKNKPGIAAGYLNLAFLHLEARNFREAEQKCRESLAICEELGHAQLAADNYTTLGDIALEGGDLDKAEHHYQESRRISHQREAINEEMGALRRLSSLCIKQQRFADARDYADAAYTLVQRIGSKFENAQIEVILGDLELQQGKGRKALEHYERASAQFVTLSKYRLAATVLAKIGLIHVEKGNEFEARRHFDRAQEFVRADIGRELPAEFVELQQALRAHPGRPTMASGEAQRLLNALQELSRLTDYAAEPNELIRTMIELTTRAVGATTGHLAIKRRGKHLTLFDDTGSPVAETGKQLVALLERMLATGAVTDSRSSDLSDIRRDIEGSLGGAVVCVPVKAMNEDLGCLLFGVDDQRLPLPASDMAMFVSLGRQAAGSLKLMLQLNENFLRGEPIDVESAVRVPRNDKFEYENLIGKSEAMKKIFRTMEKVRDADTGILILGESGTGKSALARVIHGNSPRSRHPFQEIHCAQIPHNLLESELFGHERGSFTGAVRRKLGLCEVANGGTLFLDDINVMPVETQTKLLHFLESKSFMRLGGTQRLRADVRIVAASNEDLEALCREGRFREDLYYRLKVILIDLPPLRERKDDMVAIAVDYLKRSCAEKHIPLKTLSPEAIQIMQKAPWRGNVRELQNVLERIVVLSDDNVIMPSSLPEDFLKETMGTSRQSHERLDELINEIIALGGYSDANPLLPTVEALLAKRMVSHVEGKGRAASLLGISKPTLYARLRDYDKLH